MAGQRNPDDVIRDLMILNEDLNGVHSYTDAKAVFGYVTPAQRLVVTPQVINACRGFAQPVAELNLNQQQIMKLIAFNFERLAAGGYTPQKAIRIAILRARWIKLGFLLNSAIERKTPIDEVDVFQAEDQKALAFVGDDGNLRQAANHAYIGQPGDEKKDAEAFWYQAAKDVNVGEWNLQAPLLWAVVAHVFRVRGHHYKAEYEELYQRTWKGTTMELPDDVLTWEDIGRTAIHSFGIAALEQGSAHLAANGKLTRNLLLRRNATPCGAATIGTAYAVVSSLQGTPWYKDFYAIYQPQIDGLADEYKTMMDAGIGAHMNAALYGVQRVNLDYTVAESMASVLKGYIDALPAGSALKLQKTLDKHAQASPLMSKVFAEFIENQIEYVGKASNLRKAIEGPSIQE